MSGYVLCQTRMAKTPYYIENISTNIYSVEELCFYLFHNVYLIDESLMNDELFDWLSQELKLSALAQKLKVLKGKYVMPYEYVFPIFKEINYLSYEELRTLSAQLSRVAKEPPMVRKKLKGDSLVENGMYAGALKNYQELLEALHKGEQEPRKGFMGSVYHNMGCTYSYLFQKEEAVECFERAYRHLHTMNALKSYLYAYYEARTPIEYASKLAELGVDEKTGREIEAQIQKVWEKNEVPVYGHNVDVMLEKLTKEYHRSTGS